jgi:hypothetical protein
MGFTDYKLRYQIEGDNSKLKSAIADSEKGFAGLDKAARGAQGSFKSAASEVSNIVAALTGDRLSGAASQVTSLSNAFSAIPGPAGLAIGAVAGLATVAVGAGTALFELTKKAADYGSIIHDASDKTGLHAETLSAMDIAAKQSGTSLDTVTAGLAKFAKNVSAGKDELKAFGITPQQAIKDLDGSLAIVFKRIVDAKPGYEQIVLAQKAFGKSGADLLPFIKQFSGDLPGLIAYAKKLGLTLSDEDARAADEFGDQMVQLDAQLAAAGRTIGYELMPVFLDMSRQMSEWLKDNKGEVKAWGDSLVTALLAVRNGFEIFITDLQVADEWSSHFFNTDKYYRLLDKLAVLEQKDKNFFNGTSVAGGYSGVGSQVNELTTPIGPTSGPRLPFPDFSEKSSNAAKKFNLSPMAKSIVDAANKIGISPLDLATIIGYESAGSFSTSIDNGKGHFGLIQFGKAEAAQYGASKGQSFDAQLGAVDRYLEDRFAKAGKSLSGTDLLSLYRAVLGGSPTASIKGHDANGTSPLSAVHQMLLGGGHGFTQADALKKFFGGKTSNVPSDNAGSEYARLQKQGYDEDEKAFDTAWKNKKDIQKAGLDYLTDLAEREVKMLEANGADYVTASEKAKAVERLKIQAYQDEIDALEDLFAHTADLNKQAEIRQQIDLKTIEMQRAVIKITDDEHDSVVRLTSKYYDLADGLKAAQSATEDFIQATNGGQAENVHGTGSQKTKGFLGRILESLGIDGDRSEADSRTAAARRFCQHRCRRR